MPYADDKYVPCWKLQESDVWNFESTLALFIADGLDLLADVNHGYPAYFENGDDWNWQLRHHANLFRTYAEDGAVADAPSESLLWLGAHFGHLWD